MQKQKGFTIIELIVVVAIIGVLAAIVTTNVVGYINKTKDAAIKANVNKVFNLALDYYLTNGKYDGFCNSNERIQLTMALAKLNPYYAELDWVDGCSDPLPGGVHMLVGCDNRAGEWQYMAYLLDGSVYCIDYTGNKLTFDPGVFNRTAGACECANMYFLPL